MGRVKKNSVWDFATVFTLLTEGTERGGISLQQGKERGMVDDFVFWPMIPVLLTSYLSFLLLNLEEKLLCNKILTEVLTLPHSIKNWCSWALFKGCLVNDQLQLEVPKHPPSHPKTFLLNSVSEWTVKFICFICIKRSLYWPRKGG